jgi:hypothetical protein
VCSEAGDEVVACSGARVEDGKWQQCSSVWGDRKASAWQFQKIAKCCERERMV